MQSPQTFLPAVTIVVVPRERFSFTRQSLQSIYRNTEPPFSLVYVTGGAPAEVRNFLSEAAHHLKFEYVPVDHYLTPNEARNIGLKLVKTKYVLFTDNDVLVQRGWLKNLIACGEETGAAIVTPLNLEGTDADMKIHMAGGDCGIRTIDGVRSFYNAMHHARKRMSEVAGEFKRTQSGSGEFHCMLVRRDVFEQIGFLDEGLKSTREHIDLALLVKENGGTIWFEPSSVMSYVPATRLTASDAEFYFFRWSEESALSSVEHFEKKWNVKLPPSTIEIIRRRREHAGQILSPVTTISSLSITVTGR